MIDLEPRDRVLLLSMPPVDDVQELVRRVAEGLVVGIVDVERVHDTRRELRDCGNIMITPADPEGAIPWRDGFFSVVYAPSLQEPSAEILRVLETGGRAFLAGGAVTKG